MSVKEGVLTSSKSDADISSLLHGYQLCAATEGKSPNALVIVINSVVYFYDFLSNSGLSTDVTQIVTGEMRVFILYLQQKRCLSNHPYSKAEQRELSGRTINTYVRSIPFSRIKMPKIPRKVIATFPTSQIKSLLYIMNGSADIQRMSGK